MNPPCGLRGWSGFGSGSRRKNGYVLPGLSVHAVGSDPWTVKRELKREDRKSMRRGRKRKYPKIKIMSKGKLA